MLGELHDFPDGTMSIGRLDQDSEGLLLLTTDGKVSQTVRSKKVEKEYYVQLDGEITSEAIERLKVGVEIGIKGTKYMTLPCQATALNPAPDFGFRAKMRDKHRPTSWLSVIITEGKFRQVRKMTAAVGFPVLRLVRVRIGHVELNNLPSGGIIEVDNFGIRL